MEFVGVLCLIVVHLSLVVPFDGIDRVDNIDISDSEGKLQITTELGRPRPIKVVNLARFTSVFSDGCLIQVINYEGIDLDPDPNPVHLSRYNVLLWKWEESADWFWNHFYPVEHPPTRNRASSTQNYNVTGVLDNYTKLKIMNGVKGRWNCVAQFYLFPPGKVQQAPSFLNRKGLAIPGAYVTPWIDTSQWSFQGNFNFEDETFNSLSRPVYRILVSEPPNPPELTAWDYWKFQMDVRSNLIHLQIEELKKPDHNNGMVQTEISKVFLVCQQCVKRRKERLEVTLLQEFDIWWLKAAFADLDKITNIPWSVPYRDWGLQKLKRGQIRRFQVQKRPFEKLRAQRSIAEGNKVVDAEIAGSLLNNISYFYYNKFDKGDPASYYFYLCDPHDLKLPYMKTTNTTLSTECDHVHQDFAQNIPRIQSTESVPSRVLTLVEDSMTFVTCSPPSQTSVSFLGFYSSFDIYIWITIFVLYVFLGVFLYFVQESPANPTTELSPPPPKSSSKSDKVMKVGFIGVHLMLEQGHDLVKNQKKRPFLYCIFGPLILMNIILTNGYKGRNITDLIAPIVSIPYSSIDQLIGENFTIYSAFAYMTRYYAFEDETEFRYFSNVLSGQISKRRMEELNPHISLHPKALTIFEEKMKRAKGLSMDGGGGSKVNTLSYKDILSGCNKTAYICWMRECKEVMMELKTSVVHPASTISFGKDKALLVRRTGWSIENWKDVRIFKRFQGFHQGGFCILWNDLRSLVWKIRYSRHIAFKEPTTGPTKTTLYGNILAQFTLYATGLFLASLVFIWEVRLLFSSLIIPNILSRRFKVLVKLH